MTAVRSGAPERRRGLQCVRLVEETALKAADRQDSGVRVPNTALIHSANIQNHEYYIPVQMHVYFMATGIKRIVQLYICEYLVEGMLRSLISIGRGFAL